MSCEGSKTMLEVFSELFFKFLISLEHDPCMQAASTECFTDI